MRFESAVPLKYSNMHNGLKGRDLSKIEITTVAAFPTHLATSIVILKKYFAIFVVVDT